MKPIFLSTCLCAQENVSDIPLYQLDSLTSSPSSTLSCKWESLPQRSSRPLQGNYDNTVYSCYSQLQKEKDKQLTNACHRPTLPQWALCQCNCIYHCSTMATDACSLATSLTSSELCRTFLDNKSKIKLVGSLFPPPAAQEDKNSFKNCVFPTCPIPLGDISTPHQPPGSSGRNLRSRLQMVK